MTSKNIFSNAVSYEHYVGRWSRLVAQRFVAWLAVTPESAWLDVGSGTGVLTQVILEDASPAKIVGVDFSEEYIGFARGRIDDERVEFKIGDAINFVPGSQQFDAAVAGLVLNFVTSPEHVIKNMSQAVRRGGVVAAYVWDYGGEMEMMRHFWDAAALVDPSSQEADAGQRFAICKPDNLRALFESLNLTEVNVVPIDIQTQFKNFDDYWLPFLGAQGSVSKYLRELNDETRAALYNQLQQQLPTAQDGSISLLARAWTVKGENGNKA